jgi:hypothetical protein
LDPNKQADSIETLAKECVTAASWVPSNSRYDAYRGHILSTAGDLLNRSSTKALKGRSWARAYHHPAAYAVRVWDATLRYTPVDPTGEFRERRAWALMQCGELEGALKQALDVEPLRKDTWRYAYNLACLYSSMNKTEDALSWLDRAIRKLDFENIHLARNEPDLENLRAQQQAGFANLVAVKYAVQLEFGVFNDDVLLRNTSAFALSNVSLALRIKSGSNLIERELSVERIERGQTHRWMNALRVPNNRVDEQTATLVCDQNR